MVSLIREFVIRQTYRWRWLNGWSVPPETAPNPKLASSLIGQQMQKAHFVAMFPICPLSWPELDRVGSTRAQAGRSVSAEFGLYQNVPCHGGLKVGSSQNLELVSFRPDWIDDQRSLNISLDWLVVMS